MTCSPSRCRRPGRAGFASDVPLRALPGHHVSRLVVSRGARRAIGAFSSYQGLVAWAAALAGWVLEIVRRAADQVGFVTQPHRWIVERTFAWLGDYHRLGKDYERLPESSEALVYLAMIHLMVRRLAPAS